MSGIKYYRLGDGEELPEEFCAIRDVNGEPDEYAWYEPMDAFDRKLWDIFKDNDWVVASEYRKLKAENVKLREMLAEENEELAKMRRVIDYLYSFAKACGVDAEDMRELGVEASE